ncbi:uncharacterized protein BDW70DRAFT_157790 [Aspergillus foveolatus]|uniref:uncharacterized protein n=1 Tax=Aspergillus foveolatus TaxID=210207 RepID=UPI003CCE20AF
MDSIILTGLGWGQFLDHAKQILDLDRIRDPDLQAQIPLSAWRDELGRLRIWASDVGVYQTRSGHASLDGLLNEFPTVKSQVLRQLTRIQRLLGDLEDELRNTGKDSDHNSEVEEEQEDEDYEQEKQLGQNEKQSSRTAIQDIYMHFQDSINGLNRMSVIISQRTSFNTETGPRPETMHSARRAWQTQSGTCLETEAGTTEILRDVRGLFGGGGLPSWRLESLYICCKCNDGPKVYTHNMQSNDYKLIKANTIHHSEAYHFESLSQTTDPRFYDHAQQYPNPR